MVYPGAGIAVSNGSSWGTSLADPLTVGHGGTNSTTSATARIALAESGGALAWVAVGATGNAGKITVGSSAPGTLDTGEISVQYAPRGIDSHGLSI